MDYAEIMRILLLFVTLFFLIPVSAGVYRSVDADGNTVYTDKPSPDAEEIRIDKVQTIPAGADDFVYTPPEKSTEIVYTKLNIVAPKNNHVFTDNTGDMIVSVLIEPELNAKNGDRLVLTMNGKKEPESSSISFSFTNLDRGVYKIKVDVVDKDGKTLKSSKRISFTMNRTSILNPNHPAAPRPAPF